VGSIGVDMTKKINDDRNETETGQNSIVEEESDGQR